MRSYGSVRGAISDGRPYRDSYDSSIANFRVARHPLLIVAGLKLFSTVR